MKALMPAPPAHDHTAIPIYKLYGYGNVWTAPDPLFCETIAAQEKLHNWHVTPHKHADLFQVLFLESGAVTVVLDGQTRTLVADLADEPTPPPSSGYADTHAHTGGGHLVLVPQQVVHEFIFQAGASGYILTLTYALLHPLCTRYGLNLSTLTDPATLQLAADDSHTALTFRRLNDEYRSLRSPQRGPLLESLLGIVLVWIHRHYQPVGTRAAETDPGSQHLNHYAQMIEAHHKQQHQVAWYARRVGVTPAHLNSITQMLAGKTALQMIHDRLLLEARRELIYTTRTIGTIADSLGFADPGYFTRFFKRLTGQSPKDFRRRALDATRTPSPQEAPPDTAIGPQTTGS